MKKNREEFEEVVVIIAKTIYRENHWDDGDFVEWQNLESDDIYIKEYMSQAKAVVNVLIEAGIIQVKGATRKENIL